MIERLYSPDFSALFDSKFANPFAYPLVDSLQWPLLVDMTMDAETKELLSLKDERNREVFYHRKITFDQWDIERTCSGFGHVLFQALYLDESHRITNHHVIGNCIGVKGLASAIICPELKGNDVAYINMNTSIVAGIVFYPLFQAIDINAPTFQTVMAYCDENKIPVKWDFYQHSIAKSATMQEWLPRILAMLAKYKNLQFIFSGLDLFDIEAAAQKMKYYPRVWLEIDPRVMGGTHPAGFFSRVFELPGFINNCWDRVVIGSATPTLEASQLVRGLWEASESLPFQLKCLVRTWLPRNALRVFKLPLDKIATEPSFSKVDRFQWKETSRTVVELKEYKQAVIDFELRVQSFSITQLLWLQPAIEATWAAARKDLPAIETGELLVRTYHTTTSMIMNEHERGNYLQMHYDLAAKSRDDPTNALHTVAAEENRADFNYPDHILSSSIGDRSLTIPIAANKLDMGSRENTYILVTFGPRGVKLKLRYTLYFK
nr:YjbQ family protein [Candidatus Sigynarchaeum springense]